jgi:hypothetical protein
MPPDGGNAVWQSVPPIVNVIVRNQRRVCLSFSNCINQYTYAAEDSAAAKKRQRNPCATCLHNYEELSKIPASVSQVIP